MPRFKVLEKRAYTHGVFIDAEDEEAASHFQGEIVEESETDSYGDEILSVEQVDDDAEYLEL
jgi:hypothetical protein